MAYPDYMRESIQMVHQTRAKRLEIDKIGIQNVMTPLTEEGRKKVL